MTRFSFPNLVRLLWRPRSEGGTGIVWANEHPFSQVASSPFWVARHTVRTPNLAAWKSCPLYPRCVCWWLVSSFRSTRRHG